MRRLLFLLVALWAVPLSRADWPRFHGPSGNGVATGKLPTSWSDTENILWKKALPGIGASSPVIIGDHVFLTSAEGGAEDLVRHVLCLDAKTGEVVWDAKVDSVLPEQERIREEHGYASATPVADEKNVWVFFGKSGVFCFDHKGKKIWNTQVGSNLHGWGSAASLTLHKNLVLVNACVESETLFALDKATGKEVWKTTGIKECWHAPVVAEANGKTEIITALAGEMRAFNAANGTELWRCKTGIGWYMCPLPLVHQGTVYAVGGRSGVGGLAVKLGGSGDVTAQRLWSLDKGTNVPSPVIHEKYLYFVHEGKGVLHCVDLASGEFVNSEELSPTPGQVYASPILVGNQLLILGRSGQAVVVALKGASMEVIASPVLESRRGVFNASPVLDNGRLYLRSNKFLYCIGTK